MIYQDKFEKLLKNYLSSKKDLGELHQALEYMLVGQGKRIRPMLLLSASDDLGILSDDSYLIALAIEFLHTSTLLHDDLPALDNDDYRRGKPSCHRAFSESTAILTGDIMASLANSLILSSKFSENQKNQYMLAINQAFQEICYGQILDLAQDEKRDFLLINQHKTAALFECIFKALFIMTDKNRCASSWKKYQELGRSIGQLFQLINDFLDKFAPPSELGRNKSSDQANQKLTLVSSFTMKQSSDLLKTNYQQVINTLEILESEVGLLSNLRIVINNLWSKTSLQIGQNSSFP